ncbi:uncharacterized protein ccdc142 [Scomber scombrus]|uniref:uncharacterized protein ccdc142 n=1 Tax=Scomber scombrus TaxID=13677 RepID=UPI002DD887F1|nr:uncharacterized protein ccdc142 [Scomber scombrus]
MDHNNSDILRDHGGKPGLTGDWENSEPFSAEKEQWRCSPCMVTEDLTTNGSRSQSSISRSLQRAETLFRSTFNPSLKWLFHGRSQDEEEEEEEGNFVVAHNLVSRSSARLLHLQQALLAVAPQWQPVSSAQMGSPQVCVKGFPAEGGVLLLSSSSFLQGYHRTLCRLLEERSRLLFIHEYTRRARITAAYISRVSKLLNQNLSSCSSFRVGFGSLCQELRVHLNHWSCLSSKVQSDPYLRPALVQQAKLLLEIRQTLDLLGLQALVVMEHYVHVVLSAIAQTELDCVPREVLEDILAGTDLYSQAVEEQRAQASITQLRTTVLQHAHYSTLDSSLTNSRGYHPTAFSVKELMKILAVHHADMAAKHLHRWASEQSYHICKGHTFSDNPISQVSRLSCGTFTLRSKWTWEQHSSPLTSITPLSPLQSSAHHNYHKTPPVYIPDHHPSLSKPTPVLQRPEFLHNDQTRSNFPNQCQIYIYQTSVDALNSHLKNSNLEKQTSLENCKLLQTATPPSASLHHLSSLPRFCQQDQSSVELLFQVLVSSNDLLAPLVSHTPTPEAPAEQMLPHTKTTDVPSQNGKTDPLISNAPITDSVELNGLRTELIGGQNLEGTQQGGAELETTIRPEATASSGFEKDGDPKKEETVGAEGTTVEPECVRQSRSVQWLDIDQSLVFDDLFGQYRTLLWSLCSKALWLQLHVPPAGNNAGSINLHDNHRRFQILNMISQASKMDLIPNECRTMLEDFNLCFLVNTAHAHWDYVICRSLGSALKDKCLTDVNHSIRCLTLSSKQDGSVMMSETMEHFLQLSPPFLSSLCCHQSNSRASGCFSLFPSRLTLQRQTVSLVLATVQLSTAWVMSKAYQFLSSWSLNKFLLITQGDLKVLRESVDMMVQQTKSLIMNSDNDHHSTLHNHSQLLLRQQIGVLDKAVCELQTFSSLVLKTFSNDCKRMSGEIFEQTMPSAAHWRPHHRTGFPSSPSEYAALAAQTVIGQVVEGVAPLSDEARVQALSITMTAFMEAWMEHILKQKIKFSVQGALQLKQDFDSIKELIQSDRYGLPAELHQRLLSLRVFQQVDSAVVCLLQQTQAKPYLQSRTWEPFSRCCPSNSSRNSIDAAVGSSITNLRSMEGEDMTQSDLPDMTTDLSPVDPSTPGEPYLAPSLALGAAQQEWLDLRIHNSTRRWRLPGLHCLSNSEP